jgi:hypothetical protein
MTINKQPDDKANIKNNENETNVNPILDGMKSYVSVMQSYSNYLDSWIKMFQEINQTLEDNNRVKENRLKSMMSKNDN